MDQRVGNCLFFTILFTPFSKEQLYKSSQFSCLKPQSDYYKVIIETTTVPTGCTESKGKVFYYC